MFLKVPQIYKENNCIGVIAKGPHVCGFVKKRLIHRFFLWNLQNFKNTLFYRTPPVAASVIMKCKFCSGKHSEAVAQHMAKFARNLETRDILLNVALKERYQFIPSRRVKIFLLGLPMFNIQIHPKTLT